MYCSQIIIQEKNYRDWLKNRKSFPLEAFAVYGSIQETFKQIYNRPFIKLSLPKLFKFLLTHIWLLLLVYCFAKPLAGLRIYNMHLYVHAMK